MDLNFSSHRFFQCIYGQMGRVQQVAHWICPVAHHITTPSWTDEVKMELPTPLSPKHHLLFTFLHVSCDLAKKNGHEAAGPETVVGYSWLPLMVPK